MGILEGIVIVTLILTGAFVGYHAWQDSLNTSQEAIPHLIDLELLPAYYPEHETSQTIQRPFTTSFLIALI